MGCKTSKKEPVKLSNDELALLEVKKCRDKIKQYIKKLAANTEKKRELAKEALRQKNKDRAKQHLRCAKMFQEQINASEGKLSMLENQINGIEQAKNMKEVQNVLIQGNKVLKQLQKEVSVEKFQEIADDMEEIKAQQDEIADFFRERGINQSEYESEVDNELNDLEAKLKKDLGLDLPKVNKEEIEIEKENKVEERKKVAVEA